MIFCFPNCDAGSHKLIESAERYCEQHSQSRIFVNLDHWDYWSLLHQADVMLGNSSSALMEAPSVPLPVVNVGQRQRGRLMAANVIDCAATVEAIVAAWQQAVSPEFRQTIHGMENPYGDGHAAERMCDVLIQYKDRARLLDKQARTLCNSDKIDGFLR